MSICPSLSPASGFAYELRFMSLFDGGRALVFPCNAQGEVDESLLSQQALKNYLRALTVVGREWATPKVQRVA